MSDIEFQSYLMVQCKANESQVQQWADQVMLVATDKLDASNADWKPQSSASKGVQVWEMSGPLPAGVSVAILGRVLIKAPIEVLSAVCEPLVCIIYSAGSAECYREPSCARGHLS